MDNDDAPIIAALPGQILRRAARTRIRKPGAPADGRFGAPRAGRSVSGTSSNDHHMSEDGLRDPAYEEDDRRRGPPSDESDDMYSAESGLGVDDNRDRMAYRRPSNGSTEESAIYDSYVDSSNETSIESSTTSLSLDDSNEYGSSHYDDYARDERDAAEWEEAERTPTESMYRDPGRDAILGDATQRYGNNNNPPSPPETVRREDFKEERRQENAYAKLYTNPPPQTPPSPVKQQAPPVKVEAPPLKRMERQQSTESLKRAKEEEKKKRGGFFSSKKDKDKDSKPKKEGKKEKEGFLGSLFGSKKKVEEPAPLKFSAAGPAAAAALLGTSKSAKSLGLIPMTGHSPTSPGFSPYARYPIHVERAIYRLSHIKLANPRRPLYEQVLISNLMFWYLGIINKPQAPPSPVPDDKAKTTSEAAETKEKATEPSSPSMITMSEKSPVSKSSRSSSPAPAPQRTSSPPAAPAPAPEPAPAKRTGLRKPETQSRTRAAETPVRTPQYGVQNMQMQQEYNRSSGVPVGSPSRSQPPPNAAPPVLGAPMRTGLQPSPRLVEEPPRGQIPRSTRSPDLPHAPQGQGASPKHQGYREQPANLRVDVDLARSYVQHRHEVQRSPEAPYPVPHHRPENAYRERKSVEPDNKPRSPHSPHSGIQPGQIFHHSSVQPGQVFSAQRTSPGQPVGQIFSHPTYQSPTQHPQGAPEHHYGHYTELPPGAMPPRSSQQPQQWRAAPPPQSRSNSQYEYDQAKRSTSAGYAPNGTVRDMSPAGPRSFSAGDPRSHPQPQYHAPPSPGRAHDETPYNPYLRQPAQQNMGYANERR